MKKKCKEIISNNSRFICKVLICINILHFEMKKESVIRQIITSLCLKN